MRIVRLKLTDFRGIRERELSFRRSGVTVVEGPNEIGKSSLAEAIDVLFDELDTTTKKSVRAIQPADRDVGPEVELEAVAGDYAFTYRKRFFKKPQTELRVTVPRPENHTGREAHARALEILGQTVDLDLWRELRVRQDTAVEQASLAGSARLAQALDGASGTETAGDRELGLYDAVYARYAEFFTAKGKRNRSFVDVAEREERARAEVDRLAGELADLERDVDRAEQLSRRIEELQAQCVEAEATAERRQEEWAQLRERKSRVANLQVRSVAAATQEGAARNESQRRGELVRKLEQARAQRERMEGETAERQPVLIQAENEARIAKTARDAAERDAAQREALFEVRDRDIKHQDAVMQLAQLDERRTRIEAARAEAAEAKRFLESTRVTAERVEALEKQQRELERALALLEAGSPQLRLRALESLELEVDGERVSLARDAEREQAVAERSRVVLPGRLEIEVSAGTSVAELIEERDAKSRELERLLAEAGVASLGEAREELARRREAERTADATGERIRENLRDLDYETLIEKITRLTSNVAAYPAERPGEPPMANDFESAKEAKQRAREVLDKAREAAREARAVFEQRESRAAELRARAQAASVEHRLAVRDEQGLAAELAKERERKGDEELALARKQAREGAAAAEAAYSKEKQELEAIQPARVETLATNAIQAARQTVERLRESREQQAGLHARLETLGEQGLFDALEGARAEHAQRLREREATERRAAAAELLFTTLRRKREEARRSYVGPLRQKIVQLGRYVFDDSLDVELNDELRIESRALNGVVLPFESLSVGAQEQLSLIARLACATLVGEDGGVPILLDDTLGHADPARLEGMGAMLGQAGQHCQVIVLTCTPDRFRHIGDAEVIPIS